HDDCCFTPNPQDAAAYTRQVQTTLSELGSGAFVFDYDATSTTHQISLAALSGVILPTLQLPPPPPTVTRIDPSSMPCGTATATPVTITGTNFINVSGVSAQPQDIVFSGTPLTNVHVVSKTQLTATVPGTLKAGVYEIVVQTPSGASTQPVLSA